MTQDGDDSLWTGDNAPRPERRVDRYAGRHTRRHTAGPRQGPTQQSNRTPQTPRRRGIAILVLVLAVVVIVIVGLELTDARSRGDSTPFRLLPLDTGVSAVTSSTVPTSTSTTTQASPTTPGAAP
jgi:hypothetical protein